MRRRREEARPGRAGPTERSLARRSREREPRPRVCHRAVVVQELVFAVAQPALRRIVEEEIGVELVIVDRAQHGDVVASRTRSTASGDAERALTWISKLFLLGRAADRHQLLQHALLAMDQERVDPARHVARRGASAVFVERQQAASRASASGRRT
jgi:hypothetical protein